MSWKDFKIKTKLRIAFAIIIAAISIFGTLSIVRLQKIKQKATNLAEQELPFVISITQMERNWHHSVLFYQNYKNSRKPVDYFQSSSFIADAEKSLIEIQNSKFNHDQTQEDLLFIASLFKKFKALTNQEFNNNNSNNIFAEYNTIDQINVRCKEITEREIWRSAQESQLTAKSAEASINYLIGGVLFVLLISLFVSNRLSITILRPIKLVIQHAQKLAEGKILPIDKSHRKDEFGILIEAIRISNQKFQHVLL
jgi:methyl-accepting chemotaxis protein II, aspartate sensor receptor